MEHLFDTHVHLDFKDFERDFDAVIARARDAGVTRMITIGAGDGERSAVNAVEIAGRLEGVRASVGIHPHDAGLHGGRGEKERGPVDLAVWKTAADGVTGRLEKLAMDPRVVAIGETGLDYHYDFSPRGLQQEMFKRMIGLANMAGKPIIIHDREAHGDTVSLLKEHLKPGLGGTLHCFSGDRALARTVLDMGFHISIPGVVTFKKTDVLEDVVRFVPVERLLLETDAPFLAPVPHRGKRNEPAFIAETARRVAAIKGLSYEDAARITTLNALRLFKIDDGAKSDVIAYPIRDSLYLNITNRCTLNCTFCAKRRDWTVKGHRLKLAGEPSESQVMAALEPVHRRYREIVFCGYGEPTLRLVLLKSVAAEMKKRGMTVRVNTDGLANLVHGRDVTAELGGLVDVYSVSLNAPDAATYSRICPSPRGAAAYDAVKAFILAARFHARVVATAVELPGLDIEAVRRVAAVELGVEFRARPYNVMG
jgi:TatD DNase family protein